MWSVRLQVRLLIAAIALAAAVLLFVGTTSIAQVPGQADDALNRTESAPDQGAARTQDALGGQAGAGPAGQALDQLAEGFGAPNAEMRPPTAGGGGEGAGGAPAGGGGEDASAAGAPASAPASAPAAPSSAGTGSTAAAATPTALPDTGGPSLLVLPATMLLLLGSGLLTSTVLKLRRAP